MASTCRRLLPSKRWGKLKDDVQDEWVTGQRWYCDCKTKYKTKYGQVVVIADAQGKLSYVRAECPPWDMEDVRAMHTEGTLDASSVQALYEKIRTIQPAVTDVVGSDPNGLKYVINEEDFKNMPRFSWQEILTLKA